MPPYLSLFIHVIYASTLVASLTTSSTPQWISTYYHAPTQQYHRQSDLSLSRSNKQRTGSKKLKMKTQNEHNDLPSIFRQIGYKVGATTSTVVSLTFFSILAFKRDAFMITFFIGSIFNGIASKILKRLINQERPILHLNDTQAGSIQPSDKGMPSRYVRSIDLNTSFTSHFYPYT